MRSLFIFSVANVVDVITNSSSELFVFQGKTKEIVEEMVRNVYPNYRSEYKEIVRSDELSIDKLNLYFDYLCTAYVYPTTHRTQYHLMPNFTFEELYELETDKDGNVKKGWNGHPQYVLKNNVQYPNHRYDRAFVTEENHQEILNKLDPDRKMYFMFSIDDNPNWDMQEQLSQFGKRIHLG